MEEKIIIKNTTTHTMATVLFIIIQVINMGRVSDNGKSYCFITRFGIGENGGDLFVSARRNKKSDTFIVWEEPPCKP